MGRHINAILCPRYVLVVVRHGVPLEENQSGLSTRGMGKGIGCVRSTRLDNLWKIKIIGHFYSFESWDIRHSPTRRNKTRRGNWFIPVLSQCHSVADWRFNTLDLQHCPHFKSTTSIPLTSASGSLLPRECCTCQWDVGRATDKIVISECVVVFQPHLLARLSQRTSTNINTTIIIVLAIITVLSQQQMWHKPHRREPFRAKFQHLDWTCMKCDLGYGK